MNQKLVRDYLGITFFIMLPFWGTCAAISQLFHVTVNNFYLRILYMIGGFSPTIASYMVLKKHGQVSTFRQWLVKIFDIKHKAAVYGVVALFVVIYYSLGCLINGFEFGAPIFMVLVIIPAMLLGGGNEEVGWRMILQPELEKKLGFHPATWITGVIWWLWHLPLFYIQGTTNADMDFFLFGIMCLSLSYALATIRKISKGVFPCILTHCCINGLSAVFVFSLSWAGCLATLVAMILASVCICKLLPQGKLEK